MTNKNDSQIRVEKMGINVEEAEKLFSFKNKNDEFLYDSAFKITDLSENTFIDKVKNKISVEEAKDIYQKSFTFSRGEFSSLQMNFI